MDELVSNLFVTKLDLRRIQNATLSKSCATTTFYEILAEYCNLIVDYQGDWAAFIHGMYEAAATDYGDAGLADRPVNGDNRVMALSDTDLYVQTALVANSRVRNATGNDTATYLGPSQTSSILNSIPLCVDWAVTNSNSFYVTNQPEQTFRCLHRLGQRM